jgi:hypothetical protein
MGAANGREAENEENLTQSRKVRKGAKGRQTIRLRQAYGATGRR